MFTAPDAENVRGLTVHTERQRCVILSGIFQISLTDMDTPENPTPSFRY